MTSQVSVNLHRIEKLKFRGELTDGRRIELNSAEDMDQAFSPMELFLLSLAGCTAMDVQWIMEKQRQKIDKLEIEAQGSRRDEDPQYYETVDMKYTVSGPNIRKDAVERAIRLSQDKYCCVRAMLKKDVKVNISYRITTGTMQDQWHTLDIP